MPAYKGDALDRLRAYKDSLRKRTTKLVVVLIDGLPIEHAQRTYEEELKRLDRLIQVQIGLERLRVKAISAEFTLRGTELVSDLHPRHRQTSTFVAAMVSGTLVARPSEGARFAIVSGRAR